jgi:hypothetical protein
VVPEAARGAWFIADNEESGQRGRDVVNEQVVVRRVGVSYCAYWLGWAGILEVVVGRGGPGRNCRCLDLDLSSLSFWSLWMVWSTLPSRDASLL